MNPFTHDTNDMHDLREARRAWRDGRRGPGRGPRGEGHGPRGRGGRREGLGADFGPGGGFGPGFGPAFGPGAGFGGRRGRRGDVRRAVIALLAEQPMNGYGIITAVAERSEGAWQPGPGSVYPALRALEEEGLVAPDESAESDGRRKVFVLTDDGRAYAEEHAEELDKAFEASTRPQRGQRELRQEVHALHGAVMQVGMTGRPEDLEAARTLLAETRRALYRILAEAPEGSATTEQPGEAEPSDG